MSTFGATVSAYNTWLQETREDRAYDANRLINDATKNTYFIAEAIKGRPADSVIRGGTNISEPIMLNDLGSYRSYTPGQVRTPGRQNFLQTMKFPYRFTEADFTYTDAEEDLNSYDYARWKSYTHSWQQGLYTTVWNGMETDLWVKPSRSLMEDGSTSTTNTSSPGRIASIPMWVTEDGLVPPAGDDGNAFTTLAAINPTTYTNWQSQYATYDTTAMDDPINGVFAAFTSLMRKLFFPTVPGFAKYQENDSLSKLKIATNGNGQDIYSNLLRAANAMTRAGPQDPAYGMPVFQGVPVYYAKELDNALLEQNPIGTYTTAVYPNGRPRWFFLNLNYLFPVFSAKRMMDEVGPKDGAAAQYDAFTVYVRNWWNMICTSRRRQGMVRPVA